MLYVYGFGFLILDLASIILYKYLNIIYTISNFRSVRICSVRFLYISLCGLLYKFIYLYKTFLHISIYLYKVSAYIYI